jgi:hypothetical protein
VRSVGLSRQSNLNAQAIRTRAWNFFNGIGHAVSVEVTRGDDHRVFWLRYWGIAERGWRKRRVIRWMWELGDCAIRTEYE